MKDDTISRAAAVSEIESIVDTMSVCMSMDECKGMRRMKKTVLERIEALPPAQPEQPEWVQAVERWYNKALCNPCIHKPLAWALYQVWKEYDNEG